MIENNSEVKSGAKNKSGNKNRKRFNKSKNKENVTPNSEDRNHENANSIPEIGKESLKIDQV